MESGIRHQFIQRYGSDCLLASAPGRVNLIGEHTDYNEGFVLPGAINRRIYVAMAKNNTNTMRVYASQYQEAHTLNLEDIKPLSGWATYLLGMYYYLRQQGHPLSGMDLLVDGHVPLGAGMSSSAALCSAFGFGVNELFGLGLSRMNLALTGQRTEHHFAGVQCGIMDQFASLHGRKGQLMKLDCRSMDFEYIPFDFPRYSIVMLNTMVSHSLAATAYNQRRQECEAGVALLRQYYPSIHSLRDVTMSQLADKQQLFESSVFDRCSFVVEENARLLLGCALLTRGDLSSFGQLMYEGHWGLSNRYQVSCPQSDYLVDRAKLFVGAMGARQMGGGFGGCTINIVEAERVMEFIAFMQEGYQQAFQIAAEAYNMEIDEGACINHLQHTPA